MQQVAAGRKPLRPSQIDGEQLIREEEIKKHHSGARRARQEEINLCVGLWSLGARKKLIISILVGGDKQQVVGRPFGFSLLLIDRKYNERIVSVICRVDERGNTTLRLDY